MALEERTTISTEGCVIADVAIVRPKGPSPQLQASSSGQDSSAAPEAQAEVRRAAHGPCHSFTPGMSLCNRR